MILIIFVGTLKEGPQFWDTTMLPCVMGVAKLCALKSQAWVQDGSVQLPRYGQILTALAGSRRIFPTCWVPAQLRFKDLILIKTLARRDCEFLATPRWVFRKIRCPSLRVLFL